MYITFFSGMWAKDSDEEENEDNIRQRTRKPKDFSAPIGFVAGGVHQAGKKKEEKKAKGTFCLELFSTSVSLLLCIYNTKTLESLFIFVCEKSHSRINMIVQ